MKKLLSLLLIIVTLTGSILVDRTMQVYADESKILTLGADLSEEQKQLVIDYLGVDINNVVVVEVNNQDEHNLLDNIATQQQIGTRTFSCSYIEPTNFGGIHIKTVNLSWVTCEMIRNALVTSGITNCNIICMSPIEVSGTGALTGIFKAYENISGVEISEESKELASEELITTCTIAGTIGQEEASTMVSELKSEIIVDNINTKEQIEQAVQKYMSEHSIELTEEDMWKLIDLLLKLSEKDYDIEEIKQAYADIKQTASEVQEATEKTVGFFQGIWNWLKDTWQKITGKYEEIKASEQAQAIKDTMGILANTDDSLLGDSTIVTTTIEEEVLQEVETEVSNETKSEQTEDKKGHWYDFILNWFNTGNRDKVKEENTDESSEQTTEEKITFDDFEQDAQEYQDELQELEETDTEEDTQEKEDGLLQYIQQDFENPSEPFSDNSEDNAEGENAAEQKVGSFNDLVNE